MLGNDFNAVTLRDTFRGSPDNWTHTPRHLVKTSPFISCFALMFIKQVHHFPQRSCGKVMFLHLSVILFTGVLCPGGLHLGGLCLGGSLSSGRGVSVWGVSLSREGSLSGRPPNRRTVTCGWYASYWNTFLFWFIQVRHNSSFRNSWPIFSFSRDQGKDLQILTWSRSKQFLHNLIGLECNINAAFIVDLNRLINDAKECCCGKTKHLITKK